jgi:hypothetical protein
VAIIPQACNLGMLNGLINPPMKEYSSLEAFLQLQSQGQEESRDRSFTVDSEKALEKIAFYLLPEGDGWLLKIAQAAVLLAAPSLKISQLKDETRFEFGAPDLYGFDFETYFYEVESRQSVRARVREGLWSLKTALWKIGKDQKRPFWLSVPGRFESLVWDGSRLHRSGEDKPSNRLVLSVSLRAMEEGKRWFHSSRNAVRNLKIKSALQNALYTMPIPVTLDSLRLDGYAQCPTHGFQKYAYPIEAFGFATGRPGLPLPAGLGRVACSDQHPELLSLCQNVGLEELSPQFSSVVLLTARGEYDSERSSWGTRRCSSVVRWVQNGVVIQEDALDLTIGSVSLAVHISAEGLGTDLSGLRIREADADQVWSDTARRIAHYLEDLEPNLLLGNTEWHKSKKKMSLAGTLIGLGLFLVPGAAPVGTMLFFGAGILGLGESTNTLPSLGLKFDRDFKQLKQQWRCRFLKEDVSGEPVS